MQNRIQIIMPSSVELHREASIRAAIDSVLSQADVNASVLLVANGSMVDQYLLAELTSINHVEVIIELRGSAPLAQRIGREAVTAPFFGFLDDDDFLLPGALALRTKIFEIDSNADVVVTNGFRQIDGGLELLFQKFRDIEAAPLAALVVHNWLASCGALYRTRSVHVEFWDPSLRYLEWTSTAIKLACSDLVVRFLEEPTYVVNDTPGSLSKQIEFAVAAPGVLEKVLESDVPRAYRSEFLPKLSKLHNGAARALSRSDDYRSAWYHHWKSLGNRKGLAENWKFTFRLAIEVLNSFLSRGSSSSRKS